MSSAHSFLFLLCRREHDIALDCFNISPISQKIERSPSFVDEQILHCELTCGEHEMSTNTMSRMILSLFSSSFEPLSYLNKIRNCHTFE